MQMEETCNEEAQTTSELDGQFDPTPSLHGPGTCPVQSSLSHRRMGEYSLF